MFNLRFNLTLFILTSFLITGCFPTDAEKKHKGTVYSDGTVMWFSGGTGKFDKDGDYQADAGVDGGDGGGGGGGE